MAGSHKVDMDTVPIIDSHIHLFSSSELDTLAWCTPGNPLRAQHSLEQYHSATGRRSNLRGFIFVETDRKHSLSPTDFRYPFAEIDWIVRIAAGNPRSGEGHTASDARLCLSMIPWAPVPLGAEAIARYVTEVKARTERKVRVPGFRYLVHLQPRGTMLAAGFVEALRWMGRQGYLFELGVDQRQGGMWQLEEAVEMMRRAHEGMEEGRKVVVVINHMCKPDMRRPTPRGPGGRSVDGRRPEDEESFKLWEGWMMKLAAFSKTSVKLSGAFSEMEPLFAHDEQESLDFWARPDLKEAGIWAEAWLSKTLSIFGPKRVMFGSDWPVCNIGGGGNDVAWKNWHWIVKEFTTTRLNDEECRAVWAGNAARVYGIPI